MTHDQCQWLTPSLPHLQYSPPLPQVYLFCLLLCSLALSVQYAVLLLAAFFPLRCGPTATVFWSGLFPGSLLPATPITVLFLSLDRLLIVLLPSLYLRKSAKLGLAVGSCMAVLGLFAMNFAVNLAQKPTREIPGWCKRNVFHRCRPWPQTAMAIGAK